LIDLLLTEEKSYEAINRKSCRAVFAQGTGLTTALCYLQRFEEKILSVLATALHNVFFFLSSLYIRRPTTTMPDSRNEKSGKKRKIENLQKMQPIKEETTTTTSSMGWAYLPRAQLPPSSDFFPVEKFVSNAISSRHNNNHSSSTTTEEERKTAMLGYRAILDLFRKCDDLPLLTKVLLALRTSGNGTTMNQICSGGRIHSQLIHLLFRLNPFNPLGNDEENTTNDFNLVDAHLNLIVTLVSANTIFLTPALNALWGLIMNTEPALPLENEMNKNDHQKQCNDAIVVDGATTKKESNPQIGDDDKEKKRLIKQKQNSRLHGTLFKILHLVPKGKSELFPIVSSCFPFKLIPLQKQIHYVKQCFLLLQYVPTLQQQLFELVIDKCLEMDVEIRIGNDGVVKLEEKNNNNENDLENTADKDGPDDNDSKKKNDNKQRIEEMAEKLDSLMLLLFQHLQSNNKQMPTQQLYKMILPAFDSIILTTHRSKYVQFVILFLCGLDHDMSSSSCINDDGNITLEQPKLYREFAAKLIDIILDPYRATVTRQSATCYLASFVSRASFVCAETACESVVALLRFAEAYMDKYPTEASARKKWKGVSFEGKGRLEMHSLFYTVCQAAFYIMAFRGKECIHYFRNASKVHHEIDGDFSSAEFVLSGSNSNLMHIDICTERWTRLCSHHLQPLRNCLESVRGEFLILSDRFDFIEDSVIRKLVIEDRQMSSGLQNKKSSTKKSSVIRTAATLERKRLNGVGGLGRGMNPLDSFFPFDPYLLQRSYAFVEPYYRQWERSSVDSVDTSATLKEEKDSIIDGDEDITSDDSGSDDDEIEMNRDDDDDNSDDDDDADEHRKHDISSSNSPSIDNKRSEDDVILPDVSTNKDTWMKELKRARALSIADDCW